MYILSNQKQISVQVMTMDILVIKNLFNCLKGLTESVNLHFNQDGILTKSYDRTRALIQMKTQITVKWDTSPRLFEQILKLGP